MTHQRPTRTFLAQSANDDDRGDRKSVTTEAETSESALIAKLEARVEFPDDVAAEANRWQEMREYVHTDAMLLDEEDAVGTNFVLRFQQAAAANLIPRDPAPRINPRKWMPPKPVDSTLPPELGAQQRQPTSFPQDLLEYARTHEAIIQHQQEVGGLVDVLGGAAQDAMTLPIAWIKMRIQEDFQLDPLGYGRNNDQLDTLKRYERLRTEFDDGDFTEMSPKFAELRRLAKTVRAMVLEEKRFELEQERELLTDDEGRPVLDDDGEPQFIGGSEIEEEVNRLLDNPDELIDLDVLPEVAHYLGYTWQQVDPEDMRWDWNVNRFEDFRYARWAAHRAWMTEDDIQEKWEVDAEFLRNAVRVESDGTVVNRHSDSSDDPEYGGKDPEERNRGEGTGNDDDEQRRGETLAVWEYWDRVQGRVFRWVQGTGKFLDDFVPKARPARFYPFFPIVLNRVTGKFMGPSDTDLVQPLQDESNRQRTWQREAQKSAHPRFMVTKGLLRPSERQRFGEALPYSITETERAEDIAKNIFPIIPPAYNPALYDRSATILEMQQMQGIPAAALGAGGGTGLATDSAIANEQFGQQTGHRQNILLKVLREMYQAMTEINAQILPVENAIEIAGPGAVWPEINRQQMLGQFIIDADSVLDDAAARAEELKAWVDIAQIAGQLGLPLGPIPVLKKLLELMGIRDNLGTYISIPALLQSLDQGAPQAGAQAPSGSSAPNPRNNPSAQGPAGAAGGAPAGEGLSGVPAPSSVPNSPA